MSDETTTPAAATVAVPPVSTAKVGFTPEDAVAILNSVGALASVVNPALGGAVAAIEGAAALIKNTIIPAIQHAHDVQMTAAQQAQLALDSAKLRAEVGAPPATVN